MYDIDWDRLYQKHLSSATRALLTNHRDADHLNVYSDLLNMARSVYPRLRLEVYHTLFEISPLDGRLG